MSDEKTVGTHQKSDTIVLTQSTATSSCCAPTKQASCCEPSEKAACCGTDSASSGGCGCQ